MDTNTVVVSGEIIKSDYMKKNLYISISNDGSTFDVEAYGYAAESSKNFCVEGNIVKVTGKLVLAQTVDKDGSVRKRVIISASKIELMLEKMEE